MLQDNLIPYPTKYQTSLQIQATNALACCAGALTMTKGFIGFSPWWPNSIDRYFPFSVDDLVSTS